MDRVLTGKDKLRHPIPLTKQNAQELGLHVKSSCLKTRKEIKAHFQGDMREKKVNVICRTKYNSTL